MKTKRAILTGIILWTIAFLLYSISYAIPILENADTQANVVLFITIMPLVWFACAFYYKKDQNTHGLKVGQTILITAAALDALITVPLYVIPNGGSHFSFFTALDFWIIAFEILIVAALYFYARVYPIHIKSKL
ncbi:DUF5367 family protein [Thalassobellus sediminis]|uniref:DUF5367 family protein n=1 Tax=Thalassobellus sediminis TaxID=3367753 RepID=UPI00378F14C6